MRQEGGDENDTKDTVASALSEICPEEIMVRTIQRSGWYALCFGRSFKDQEDSEEKNDDERNLRREVKAGFISDSISTSHKETTGPTDFVFRLFIQTKEKDQGEKKQQQSTIITKIDILQVDNGKDIAKDIGLLYFLPQACSVALLQSPRLPSSTDPLHFHPKSSKMGDLKWYLLQRKMDVASGLEKQELFKTGAVCPAKKKIACGTCGKLLVSVHAAVAHRRSMHSFSQSKSSENNDDDNNSTNASVPDTLEVVYQDDYLAVIDKPQGIAVMGDKQSLCRSDLFLPLAGPCQDIREPNVESKDNDSYSHTYLRKPIPVHRLDAATGGLLVLAKTKEVERKLKEYFRERTCQKRYRALVLGRLEPAEGVVNATMDGGKPAITRYQVHQYHPLKTGKNGWATVVDLFPETGRKHQLRKHMKSLGHPIWGDKRYGGFLRNVGKSDNVQSEVDLQEQKVADCRHSPRNATSSLSHLMSKLCLWAMELILPHPVTGKEIEVTLKDPKWLDLIIQEAAQARP
jgi:23S rRNA-/tRNA-specific pseudouridylate synthase